MKKKLENHPAKKDFIWVLQAETGETMLSQIMVALVSVSKMKKKIIIWRLFYVWTTPLQGLTKDNKRRYTIIG